MGIRDLGTGPRDLRTDGASNLGTGGAVTCGQVGHVTWGHDHVTSESQPTRTIVALIWPPIEFESRLIFSSNFKLDLLCCSFSCEGACQY